MNIQYQQKYLKYKQKYLLLKNKYQYGGVLDFKNFPCTIYHAFNMKFTDVAKIIPTLKDSGITHVQLSPIQKCRNTIGKALMKKKGMTTEQIIWWMAYQPESYEIGNIYGTEEELQNLLTICKTNNIQIIIDIVINHLRASEIFEYPIWSIILFITETDKNEDNTSDTMVKVYNEYNTRRIKKIKDYLEHLKSTNDNVRNNKLKKSILSFLLEQDKIDYKTYKPHVDNDGNLIESASVNELINTHLDTDNIEDYIENAFDELRKIICIYLNSSYANFKVEYYDIITPPFWCTDKVLHGYNCWLAQALPQLNQNNEIVQQKIMGFLDKLANLDIKCLRIDAASHIKPEILKLYSDYFESKINNDNSRSYIYSEVITPQGKDISLQDYVRITHITEYQLINTLSNIFCFQCELSQLNILHIPSGDVGSVVFSTTHDLESIDGSAPAISYGNHGIISKSEPYKIILMLCYLLQRIYNVPLIFNSQFDNNENVRKCCILRKHLYDKKCNREYSEVINKVFFKSTKYFNEILLATFYLNITHCIYELDGLEIPPRNILIIYPKNS